MGKVKITFHIFCDFFHTSAAEVFQIHENRKVVYLVIFLLPLFCSYPWLAIREKLLLLPYIIPVME